MTEIDDSDLPQDPFARVVDEEKTNLLVTTFDTSFDLFSGQLFSRSMWSQLRRRPHAGIIFQDNSKGEKYVMGRLWTGRNLVSTYLRELTVLSEPFDDCWELRTPQSTLTNPKVILQIYDSNGILQPDMVPRSELVLYGNFVEKLMAINSSLQECPQNFKPLSCY